MNLDYDILIIGGGMVGATAALAFESDGYNVGLVEAYPLHHQDQPSYDDRSIALAHHSRLIMSSMGLWPKMIDAVAQITSIHISDQGFFGAARLRAEEEHVPALGYVIENRVFGQILMGELAKTNVDFLCPATLLNIDNKAQCLEVEIKQQEHVKTLTTRLLIAADGAKSSVRELLDIKATKKDYKQTAVTANVTPQCDHKGKAHERFTDSGVLAFLPMCAYQDKPRCSVVWTLSPDDAEQVIEMSDLDFLKSLQTQFGYRLGRLLDVGQRAHFPLYLTENTQSFAERIAFVGNAKQSLHPVAGQGFNLALRDIAGLRECIKNSTDDIGEYTVLQQYADQRKRDKESVIGFTDGLIKLFANRSKPAGCIRGLGLTAMDMIPPARQQFARFGMGLPLW